MNEEDIFKHFEKIYFHELQRKEQIFARLSIPLAVIVALAGFYAVLIGLDYKQLKGFPAFFFGFFMAMSVLPLVSGAYFFCDALLGRMDQSLATPNALEAWRQDLDDYYSDEPDGPHSVALAVRQSLYRDFMNCGSIMSINNDRKSSSLYFCHISLIAASACAVLAYIVVKSSL